VFDPGGGNQDITNLRWTFGPLSLYLGAGTQTTSPTATTAGFEDYRYDDQGGLAATNLNFYYQNTLWATGYVTSFVVEVANNMAANATGVGSAYLSNPTMAGTAFYNEIMAASNGTGLLSFTATNFSPISLTDPGAFSSDGSITVVPEPGHAAALLGLLAVGFAAWRRRRAA
jgi:hypothetical protein